MPKEDNTVLVEPQAGSVGLLFRAESWTEPSNPHLVDLSAGNGAAECSCKHWQCRVSPAIRKGADPYSKEGSCRHVRAVRLYWMKAALAAVIEAHKQGGSS